jgi:hypothetical protein
MMTFWCEFCRDHYETSHLDDKRKHRSGFEFGPFGRKLVAESIVRAVASCEPLVECSDDMGDVWFTCGFCDADKWGRRTDVGLNEPGEPIEHQKSCAWRRAREWVDALVPPDPEAEGHITSQ